MTAFLVLIATGTLLLCLPEATRSGSGLHVIDALFTSTSAGCVTGLSVIPVNHTLSLFGQIVLLLLIQVGGLGIMTISTVLVMIAGGKASFAERNLIHDTFTHSDSRTPGSILREVFMLTFTMEALGAALLFIRFYPAYGLKTGAYYAVFHSISAFCNTGFALFPDSLTGFKDDVLVNLYEKGHEVLVIDADANLVQKIRNQVTSAVVADSTDPDALKALGGPGH